MNIEISIFKPLEL